MRQIKKLTGVSMVCLLLFVLAGCAFRRTYTNVTNISPYSELVSNEFVLISDCYLVVFDDDPAKVLRVVHHRRYPEVPEDVDQKYVGANVYKTKIIGIVKKGSKFRVNSVIECKSFETSTRRFMASVDDIDTHRTIQADVNTLFDEIPSLRVVPDPAALRETLSK